MRQLVIFLDDGGVMNDNRLRGPQWQRLVGEFFVPRLGGAIEAWAEANRIVAEQVFDPTSWPARLHSASDYADFERAYNLEWLGGMCEIVGVPTPPDDISVDLAHEASAWVTRRVHAAFPGAVEAIRLLYARGYALHTASNEVSADLAGYLEAMGVRDCFKTLYGPDLVNAFKPAPEYYERIFAGVGVKPADAVVVDDHPGSVLVAAELGAWGVLVGDTPPPQHPRIHGIASLAELPRLVEGLS